MNKFMEYRFCIFFTAENSRLPKLHPSGSWRKPCDAWMPGWSGQPAPRCSARKVPCVRNGRGSSMMEGHPTILMMLDISYITLISFPDVVEFLLRHSFLLTFLSIFGCAGVLLSHRWDDSTLHPDKSSTWWSGVHSHFCAILPHLSKAQEATSGMVT